MPTDPDLLALPWRTGRHNGRTIYAQGGDWASREDTMVGVMDTPELAAEACAGHNARLAVNPAVVLVNAAIREAFRPGSPPDPARGGVKRPRITTP